MKGKIVYPYSDKLLQYEFKKDHPLKPDRLRLTYLLSEQLGLIDKVRQIDSGAASPAGGTILRPRSIAFFAGRVWYGGVKGKIYFSRIVENIGLVGECFQEQDMVLYGFLSCQD